MSEEEQQALTIALHASIRQTIRLMLSNRVERASIVASEGKYDVRFNGDEDSLRLTVTVSKDEVESVTPLH